METKEKIDYTDLYKKRDKEDTRDITRRALENLYEQIEINNRRIDALVNRHHKSTGVESVDTPGLKTV